jgi:hypothetical protein
VTITKWDGWAITKGGAIVLFDARHPIYWKRYIARREADERGLPEAVIRKVKVVLNEPARKPRRSTR